MTEGATLEQNTELPDALVIVQLITPDGASVPLCPVTTAFKTALPPRIGELEALMVTVGVKLETPKVTEFEVAGR